MASAFPAAARVRFSVDYIGLTGRSLDEPRGGHILRGRQKSATVPARQSKLDITLEKLAGSGSAEAAALLSNAVFRLFSGWEVNAEYIMKAAKDN